MSELNIPSEHYAIFKFFITLPRELKNQIVEQLKSAPIGLSPSALIDFVSDNVEKLSKDRVSDIIKIIYSLIRAKENADVDVPEFLVLLNNGLAKTMVEELQPTPQIMADFEQILLNSTTTITTAKVIDSMTENTKTFLEAKFFQDIRPVFDHEDNLIGSATIHNLKIIFKEHNEIKETFISLDDNDLDKFFTVLKNAQEKLRIIKKSFLNAKIINIK